LNTYAAWNKLGAEPGKLLGTQPDLFSDPVAHTFEITESDAIHRKQFADSMDPHSFEYVLRLNTVAELCDSGLARCPPHDRVKFILIGAGLWSLIEYTAPGAQHLLGIIITLARVSP
jgi:hypothetical protein